MITFTGALIAVFLPFLWTGYRQVLLSFVFFIPFTATAFINFGEGTDYKFLSIAHMLAFIATAIYGLKFLYKMKPDERVKTPLYAMLICNAAIVLSLAVNMAHPSAEIIKSSNLVGYITGMNEPVHVGLRNFMNYGYFLIGSVMSLIIIAEFKTDALVKSAIKIYLAACAFMAIWGLMQAMFFYTGIEYPSYIFNNAKNISALGYTGTMGDLKRISSFAVEPSVMAQTIALGYTIIAMMNKNRIRVFSAKADSWLKILFSVVLLASTSLTAIIYFIFFIAYLYIFKCDNKKFIIAFCVGSSAIVAILNTSYADILLKHYSFAERYLSVYLGLKYTATHPLFGLGFGNVTSHDMLVSLAANSGIPFTLLFLATVGGVIMKKVQSPIAKSLTSSLLLLFLVMIYTGFTYVFFMFWFIIGITYAAQINNDNLKRSEI